MTFNEGSRVRNILTAKVYEVKKIGKDWVLLQAADGSNQVLTGKMGLKFTYAQEGVKRNPGILPPHCRNWAKRWVKQRKDERSY